VDTLLIYFHFTVCILYSYLIGSIPIGYLWVRYKTGKDIRKMDSGSTGASNVGRALGPSGFLLTFMFDFFKGLFVVLCTRQFGFSAHEIIWFLIAVVTGHIWPIFLGFSGGKGIATSLGGWFMMQPPILLIFSILFLFLFSLTKKFILSGMIVYVLIPFILILLAFSWIDVFASAILSGLILWAHRTNIQEIFQSNSN
jgi:acyl phosphate:glycerol-3-phosphate acyltransferase